MKLQKPLSLTEQLVESIREDILNGLYPPDSQLRQDALAEKHGVSRIPVREALLQLEGEGLVSIVPRRGAMVTGLSLAEVDDVFALRTLLETRLYRASAPCLDAAAINAAIAINTRYRKAIEDGERSRLGILNAELHMALYVRADMPKTQQIVASLLQISERYTRIQLSTEAALQQSLIEHEALLALTRRGAFAEGEAQLVAHLQQVWQGLLQVIGKKATP